MFAASQPFTSFFSRLLNTAAPGPGPTSCPRAAVAARIPAFRTMSFSINSNNGRDGAAAAAAANVGEGAGGAPDVIEFLDSLKNYEKVGVPRGAGTESPEGFDLARMRRLISCLGDPLSHYPVVHIAGTKGKGSTAAFISNILRAEGYSVGSYTSPHIMSIHERIIAGKTEEPISPTSFQRLFQDNWKTIEAAILAEQGSLTHFEVLTALAFKYFSQVNVDIAIVEAGLGGARDATNVISPAGLAVAVITNIGKEHLAALGGSLESIALAKSGIIKQGRPVVLGGPLDSHSKEIICKDATSKNARIIPAFGEGMHYGVVDVRLDDDGAFQCCDMSINRTFSHEHASGWKIEKKSLQLRMMGCHQLDNAVTAICTILCLRDQGWRVQENAIWSGLEQTFVTGRFQIVSKAEAARLGGEHITLVLDGAHTASSAKALASTLKMVFPSDPLAFVVAMASDKDHYDFCSQLLSGAIPKVVVATEMLIAGGRFRSTSASFLAQNWDRAAKEKNLEVANSHCYGIAGHQKAVELQSVDERNSRPDPAIVITESESILSAVKKAGQLLQVTHKKGVVCITGSLHVVSAVLSLLRADPTTGA